MKKTTSAKKDFTLLNGRDASHIRWAIKDFPKYLDSIQYENRDAVKQAFVELDALLSRTTLYVRGKLK